jgi:hypothetical protein
MALLGADTAKLEDPLSAFAFLPWLANLGK